jgi:hypothetical protein
MSYLDPISAAAKISFELIDRGRLLGWPGSRKSGEELRQEQLLLLKSLTEAGIDPRLFDLLLSTELDRNLKKNFGVAFFVATIFFTLLSFGMIAANSILKWGISDVAITGLIIETPLQFIGLLYIIARNLFPQAQAKVAAASETLAKPKAKPKPKPKAREREGE